MRRRTPDRGTRAAAGAPCRSPRPRGAARARRRDRRSCARGYPGRGERLLLALLATAAAEAEDQVQRRLLLDAVIGQRALVLQLLPHEDELLLVRRDTLLVLHLGLHVRHRVRRLHLQRDRLALQRLHEDLHLRWRRSVRQGEPAAARVALWVALVVDSRGSHESRLVWRRYIGLGAVCIVESEPDGRD
jgi:hypothetical protein